MSEPCPAVYENRAPDSPGARLCEHKDGRWHSGKHANGEGALRVTWGGRANLGPKGAAARSAAGLSPPKAPAARQCEHCCEPERVTVTESVVRGGRISVDRESNLAGGRCKDRAACLERAPQLDLELS